MMVSKCKLSKMRISFFRQVKKIPITTLSFARGLKLRPVQSYLWPMQNRRIFSTTRHSNGWQKNFFFLRCRYVRLWWRAERWHRMESIINTESGDWYRPKINPAITTEVKMLSMKINELVFWKTIAKLTFVCICFSIYDCYPEAWDAECYHLSIII